jgi:hypothetical protein
MFVTDEIMLDIGFLAAQARLVDLARRGGLSGASRAAYADELSAVIRVSPFGDAAGVSKLVRVGFLDPLCRGDVMTLALRWEATGVTGAMFPVLDADITLTPAGQQATRMALAGCYRAPLASLGAGLDKMILNRVATATIRALLRNVADSLASPSATAARQAEPGQRSGTMAVYRARWPARYRASAGARSGSCHLPAAGTLVTMACGHGPWLLALRGKSVIGNPGAGEEHDREDFGRGGADPGRPGGLPDRDGGPRAVALPC